MSINTSPIDLERARQSKTHKHSVDDSFGPGNSEYTDTAREKGINSLYIQTFGKKKPELKQPEELKIHNQSFSMEQSPVKRFEDLLTVK